MDPNDIPRVQDKRARIRGLLPKNAQNLLIGAIALVMMLVILFSGHGAPKPKPSQAPVLPNPVADANQGRIQDYRTRLDEQMRRLAAEEAELARTKAALAHPVETAPNAAPMRAASDPYTAMGRAEAEKSSLEREREKRERDSLFASNVALSYRRSSPQGIPAVSEQPALPARDGQRVSTNAPRANRPEYRLFEGTILETVLTNRLDSSFSGPVNCMVTTNVYSHDGQKLLIPQGSRLLGEVKKLESAGDQRVAVIFHRLIMPDGFSVSLDQFKGLDQIGETGLRDQVNHHYLQIFGVSIALGAFAGLSQANTRYSVDESALDVYRQGIAGSMSQSALHILDRYLNVPPTFTVREGYRIKVYLSQDLILPAWEDHPVRDDF